MMSSTSFFARRLPTLLAARSSTSSAALSAHPALVNGAVEYLKSVSEEAMAKASTPPPTSTQASHVELMAWLTDSIGLRADVAAEYLEELQYSGFDSPAGLALATADDLARCRIRTGHARIMLARVEELRVTESASGSGAATAGFTPPRLFDYPTITANVSVADAIEPVEAAFGKLAEGLVDVPMPMHIGVDESPEAGPGDCHIKGGYVYGSKTFTVKLATVSFYKNLERGLPPGGGVFCVMDAVNGSPKAIMQENRFLTDLRTGAAGGVALKYLSTPEMDVIGFIGSGAIAKVMARACYAVRPGFKGVVFDHSAEMAEKFCAEMKEELGVPFVTVGSGQELCAHADVIYTQTPGGNTVLEKSWLSGAQTIICSGSDQPTKQEIPTDVLAAGKYVADLTKQTSKVGELRSALADGSMTEADVHAEIGEIVNGTKSGREGDELIVCDLTGTGAQDAAIGQVAWDKLSCL